MMRSNLSSMAGPTPSNNLFKSPLVSQMPVMSQTSIMSPTSMMSQSPLISQSPMMPQSTMMSQSTMISQSPMMPQSMMMSQTPTLQPWSSNGFASQPSWNKSSTFHFEQVGIFQSKFIYYFIPHFSRHYLAIPIFTGLGRN